MPHSSAIRARHQRRPGALPDGDLFHRAAEIDVYQVSAAAVRDARRLRHRRRLAPGKLDRIRPVAVDAGHP
jgi:hypothetical protein